MSKWASGSRNVAALFAEPALGNLSDGSAGQVEDCREAFD